MRGDYSDTWDKPPERVLYLREVLNPVGYEKHLSVTAQFEFNSFLYHLIVEAAYVGDNGLTVCRRCVERAEVASSHE